MKTIGLLFSVLIAVVVLMSLQGCLEESTPELIAPIDQLPEATTTGANIMGAIKDGQAWLPRGDRKVAIFQQGFLSIVGGLRNDEFDEDLNFIIADSIVKNQRYFLTNDSIGPNHARGFDFFTNCRYVTTEVLNGFVEITEFNRPERIVSGIFEVTLYSFDCLDTVEYTNGRFDLKFID